MAAVAGRLYTGQVHRQQIVYTAKVLGQSDEPFYHQLMNASEVRQIAVARRERQAVLMEPEVSVPRFKSSAPASPYVPAEKRGPIVQVPASLVGNNGVIVRIDATFPVQLSDDELAVMQRSTVGVRSITGAPLLLGSSVIAGRDPATNSLRMSAIVDCGQRHGGALQQRVCEDAVAGGRVLHRALVTFYGRATCCGHDFDGCACKKGNAPEPLFQFVACSRGRSFKVVSLKSALKAPFSVADMKRATSGLCSLDGTDADDLADASGTPVTTPAPADDGAAADGDAAAAASLRRRRLLVASRIQSNQRRRSSNVHAAGES